MNRLVKRQNSEYLRSIVTRYIGDYLFDWGAELNKVTSVEPLYISRDYTGRDRFKVPVEFREFPLVASITPPPETLRVSNRFLETRSSLAGEGALWMRPEEAQERLAEQLTLVGDTFTRKTQSTMSSIAMLDVYVKTQT